MNHEQPADQFVVAVDINGDIWHISRGRRQGVIGVDTQRYQELQRDKDELQAERDKFFDRLVELGEITIEKSPEEIAREAADERLKAVQEQAAQQAEMNKQMLETMKAMQEELAEIKARPPVERIVEKVQVESVEPHDTEFAIVEVEVPKPTRKAKGAAA